MSNVFMQDAVDNQDHDHDPGDYDGGDDILPDMEEPEGAVDPMDVSERAEAQVHPYLQRKILKSNMVLVGKETGLFGGKFR